MQGDLSKELADATVEGYRKKSLIKQVNNLFLPIFSTYLYILSKSGLTTSGNDVAVRHPYNAN
jgi:hypothetical protein